MIIAIPGDFSIASLTGLAARQVFVNNSALRMAALDSGIRFMTKTATHAGMAALAVVMLSGPAGLQADEKPPATAPAGESPPGREEATPRASIARGEFVALPHRPNYILPYSYVHRPNVAPFQTADPDADWKHQEIKFQISLKVPVTNDLLGNRGDRFGNNLDLWFGYTQVSYWQAYHTERSSPFRESNYEPEIGLTYRGIAGQKPGPLYNSDRFSLSSVSAGFAHQSNGAGGLLSRSWNRIWLSIDMGYDKAWSFSIKPWWRVPEEAAEDDNPDILNYAGRAEFVVLRRIGSHQLSAIWRNNLRARDNRSGYEIDWTFPVPVDDGKFKVMVQFFNGYGESLIDYNVRMRRIGIGVLVNDRK